MLYQVVGRFYTPWSAAQPVQEPMSIEVAYDRTQLAVNDVVTARVKVTNNRPGTAQMIIVDLGILPGFEVQTADLEKLAEDKTIQKYEMTGRQIRMFPGVCLRCPEEREQMNVLSTRHGRLDAGLASLVEIGLLNI